MSDNFKKQIQEIIKRIDKIEKVLSIRDNKRLSPAGKVETNFSGPKGGILLLIKRNYFNKRRAPLEVMSELEKNDYNYQLQVIRNALNRLGSAKGPLIRLSVGGKFVYVKRK
jgi:hypothetical protein